MTHDYLSTRLNVVQVPPEELNAKLAALAEAFDEAWLASEGDHPLQVRWRRNDVLSTNELLTFGDAVERLGEEDAGWLADQVNKIKTGDAGQCAGAVFEIFALNFFAREACQVIPATDSMPGFDGTVLMKDGARILVSVKNHGLSAREQAFLANARAFDEGFKAELVSRRLRDVDLNVLASKHLADADFAQLRTDLAACLDELPAGAGYAVPSSAAVRKSIVCVQAANEEFDFAAVDFSLQERQLRFTSVIGDINIPSARRPGPLPVPPIAARFEEVL